jgi:hypothetical protein
MTNLIIRTVGAMAAARAAAGLNNVLRRGGGGNGGGNGDRSASRNDKEAPGDGRLNALPTLRV